MTKNMTRILKQVGIPTVRVHASGQYFARVGYRENRRGIRQRAFHYIGFDENAAIANAAVLKSEWRSIKRSGGKYAVWPPTNAASARLAADETAPHPSMGNMTRLEIADAIKRHHDEMTDDAIEGGQVEWQKPRQRIEQVRESYLEYRRGKLGIGHGQGIDDKTYSSEVRNLKAALESVNGETMVNSFDYAQLERLRDAIYRRVGVGEKQISKRTANNYWNEARRFFDWSHRQANVNYRHPENSDGLFKQKIKNANDTKIVKYDAELLKRLLKSATNRQRLYVYLALNCGHYQIDIGTLRRNEITIFEGREAIVRKRSKTSHQNDFEALHTLWPETAALLKMEMDASRRFPNVDGLALLSKTGTALYRKKPHCDIISDLYLKLQNDTDVDLSFKQLRKLGSTAIQRIGGDEARRLYKAGTIDSGDKVYVLNAWEKLTPHLMAWGDELRADGVLTMPSAK